MMVWSGCVESTESSNYGAEKEEETEQPLWDRVCVTFSCLDLKIERVLYRDRSRYLEDEERSNTSAA